MNLVFASGFLIPQQFLNIHYFRGLKERLAAKHQTLFHVVPPIGSSEDRARVLGDAINQQFPSGPVHIIAHSMGGLDSRTLIARNHHGLGEPGRIASLTTLSTPHRGSPVADLLAGPKPTDLRRIVYESISQALGGLGIPTGALGNLTTEKASQVPDVAASHPHIRFRSYFASGRTEGPPTAVLLLPTYHYIHSVTQQPNDGVVALSSAKYGEFQEPAWACDHVDMVGHNLDGLDLLGFRFDHFAAIDRIIAGL